MWQLPQESLRPLLAEQAGMLARRQLLAHGVEWERVRTQVEAQRWVERTPRVISTTTGELTLEQREWLAVLHAGPRSMLANLSAAGRHGLENWHRPYVSAGASTGTGGPVGPTPNGSCLTATSSCSRSMAASTWRCSRRRQTLGGPAGSPPGRGRRQVHRLRAEP